MDFVKIFLDENIGKSKSFVLYGNLNDMVIPSDLIPRSFEEYLVELLKQRGFEHVIFYGESGTRGAYCRDEKSARFFFGANKSLPEAKGISENFDLYYEVFTKKISQREIEKSSNSSFESPKVHYAYRGLIITEFLQMIDTLMKNSDNHMAVVFYNIFTTSFPDSIKDYITTYWETMENNGNICILLAPDTLYNESALIDRITRFGLESKFLIKEDNCNIYMTNPINCIRISYPGSDEIKNMLRYFRIAGTQKNNRIVFDVDIFDELAARVQYVSGKFSSKIKLDGKTFPELLSQMFSRIGNYLDKDGMTGEEIDFSTAVIDEIWNVNDKTGKSLEKLNRKGWEKAYKKVKEALDIYKIRELNEDKKKKNKNVLKPNHDFAVGRFQDFEKEEKTQIGVPNFVLLGNPGTGKTTIARIIGEALREAGIIKVGTTVEVTKKDLTSSYVAGVPAATMKKVNEAEEGVLFIDEAHLIGAKDGGVGHDGTGHEVVSTLNAAMTSNNHHFSVILAGYENSMEKVWELDPGFKSRFGDNFIVLEDYSPELLKEILVAFFKENNYEISKELTEEKRKADTVYVPLITMTENIYSERDRMRFGNARTIKDIAAYAMSKAEKSGSNIITQECFYGAYNDKINGKWFEPTNVGATLDQIIHEIDEELVGMNKIKDYFYNLGTKIEEQQERGLPTDEIEIEPILLVGSTGVGKTTMAKKLARMFYHYHLLGTPNPIILNAASLAGTIANSATERIMSEITKAQNTKGMLFIDEAHQLLDISDGQNAFRAFMAPLTDKEKPFLAVFALYKSKLDDFLAIDDGAPRRFKIIEIEDYTGEELFLIMKKMVAQNGCTTSEDTDFLMKQFFEKEYHLRNEKTGNAGMVKRVINEMDENRRRRCKENNISFASPESRMLCPQDIPEKYTKNLLKPGDSTGIEKYNKIKQNIEKEKIGLKELKQILISFADKLIYWEKYPRQKGFIEPGHYFFKGNPGTGKTTAARFVAKYLYELGIVKSPEPDIISASELVAGFVGQTAILVRNKLNNSMGKVLMIDEAYALNSSDKSDNFKADAINELIKFLDSETFRRSTCVIFAGYDKEMENLYPTNRGFKSRVTEVYFPDFDEKDSLAVLKSFLSDDNYTLSEEAEGLCCIQIRKMLNEKQYGNGRTMRNYAGILIDNLVKRCNYNSYDQNDPLVSIVLAEDLPDYESVVKSLNLL